MALSRIVGVNHAFGVTQGVTKGGHVGGIACAAYTSSPPRNGADFLELAENGPFLDRKPISAFYETVDGQSL